MFLPDRDFRINALGHQILSGSEVLFGCESSGHVDGIAKLARFNRPDSIVVDAARNGFYVSDTLNHCIRHCDLVTRAVTTVAGAAGPKALVSSGPALQVALSYPRNMFQLPATNDGREQIGVCCESGVFVYQSPFTTRMVDARLNEIRSCFTASDLVFLIIESLIAEAGLY